MNKISIIVRTKNEERWISHCLKSIYDQNYPSFEVILVDNESNMIITKITTYMNEPYFSISLNKLSLHKHCSFSSSLI